MQAIRDVHYIEVLNRDIQGQHKPIIATSGCSDNSVAFKVSNNAVTNVDKVDSL